MVEFSYKAVRTDGTNTEGTISSRDRPEAVRRLSANGLQVFEVVETAASQPSQKAAPAPKLRAPSTTCSSSFGKPRLGIKQLIAFTEELSDLLNAGVQLEPALQLIEGRKELSVVSEVAATVRQKIREGGSFAKALASTSPSFGDLYCNLVAAGEASGSLPQLLQRQVIYLMKVQELRGKLLTSFIYPAFLIVSGGAVTILFITFLIPRLTLLIESTGNEIPTLVQVVVGVSDFFKAYWWAVLLALTFAFIGFRAFVKAPANRPWWDRVKIRFPLIGKTLLSQFHVHFLQTLGNLLENGLTIIEALKLTRGITPNLALKSALSQIEDEVVDGAPLHRSMEKSEIFPTGLIDLVRISEQTGKLTFGIKKAGQRYDRELERRIERMSAMIQPLIILVMAGVIGIMAYMMITVIYDTISLLRSR